MLAHVTALWLCAKAWCGAPSRQPVPRKGDVCVGMWTCWSWPVLSAKCLWKCMTGHGYSRQKVGESTGAGVEA